MFTAYGVALVFVDITEFAFEPELTLALEFGVVFVWRASGAVVARIRSADIFANVGSFDVLAVFVLGTGVLEGGTAFVHVLVAHVSGVQCV